MKTCKSCEAEKPLTEGFHRDRSKPDGRRNICKACGTLAAKQWNHENADRHRANADRWADENRERMRELWRAYYARNADSGARERRRAYRQAHPEQYQEYARRRRARLAGATPGATDTAEFRSILLRDPCTYCGGEANAVDHIVPLSSGGADDWTNLTAACGLCNSRKRTAPLLVFLERTVHA